MRHYLLDTTPLTAYTFGRDAAVERFDPWLAGHEAATSVLVYAEVIVTNETSGAGKWLQPQDKEQVLERMGRSWDELQAMLNGLSKQQLTAPGREDWSVKDHLTHLAAWERSALFLVQGKPRHEGLRVDESTYLSGDDDRINDAIYRLKRERSLSEVRLEFEQVHRELRATVERLSVEDLAQPYAHYLPDEPDDEPDDNPKVPPPPVLDWIVGNSYVHFDEHRQWMRAIVATPRVSG